MAAMVRLNESDQLIEIQVTGRLTAKDYEEFVPAVEQLLEQHGALRLMFEMNDFHGWSAGALWEDLKFAAKHFSDIERLAIVGEKRWQKGMAAFCRPFTKAVVRYFGHSRIDDARAWLREGKASPPLRAHAERARH